MKFEDFAKNNGFSIDPNKVKTRGLGEKTNACIKDWLIELNKNIGMSNPIPYRNRQSTVLPRKSLSSPGEYVLPWQLRELKAKKLDLKDVREKMRAYSERRLEEANISLKTAYGDKAPEFKPRPRKRRK